jgi:phenylpropionate dioxygenase-like ring-hydroxylating dioxygenase large terminal subunit
MTVELSTLSDSLTAGATLPADWYSDPAIHRLELERIFSRCWQVVGRIDQVAEPGGYFAAHAGHVPIVVAREPGGRLNAFVNVCRHRAHLVVRGEGRRETLQCPYHAWTYRLDGTLHRAPRSEREPGFDPDRFSLIRAQVDTWGPLVFVNPDLDGPPLAETLGDLTAVVARSGLDLGGVRFHQRREWELPVNWKVVLENYLECYHCAVAHPGFSKVIDVDPDAYRLEARGLVASQFGPVRELSPGAARKAPYVIEGPVRQAQFHAVWPNLTINIEPGPANVSIDVIRPDGPGRAVGHTDWFFGEDVSAEAAQGIVDFETQVGLEDNALIESVQRGLDSGLVPQGRLLLNSEHLIQHFQRLVYDALTA